MELVILNWKYNWNMTIPLKKWQQTYPPLPFIHPPSPSLLLPPLKMKPKQKGSRIFAPQSKQN